MQNEKTMKIIEAIRNMTDREAGILEVFISGFQAGKQVAEANQGYFLEIPRPTWGRGKC